MSPMSPACMVFSRSLTAVVAGEEVVPASADCSTEAGTGASAPYGQDDDGSWEPERSREVRSVVKMDSTSALIAKGREIVLVSRSMGMSHAKLSLRVNLSADWQNRRSNPRNDEADAEILSNILDIISNMPSYDYRRV